MELVVTLSVILGALAVILTSVILLWTKLVRPVYRFAVKTGHVVDVVLDLPEWCESVDATLSECKEEVANLKTAIDEHIKNTSV